MLDTMAGLVDSGQIRTTATETLSPNNAANLIEAHRRIESAATRGKIVLQGWDADHERPSDPAQAPTAVAPATNV